MVMVDRRRPVTYRAAVPHRACLMGIFFHTERAQCVQKLAALAPIGEQCCEAPESYVSSTAAAPITIGCRSVPSFLAEPAGEHSQGLDRPHPGGLGAKSERLGDSGPRQIVDHRHRGNLKPVAAKASRPRLQRARRCELALIGGTGATTAVIDRDLPGARLDATAEGLDPIA